MGSRSWWNGLLAIWVELLLVAIFVGSIATVWHIIKQHDRAHVHRMTMLAAAGIQADFEADMRERLRAQLRLGQLWQIAEDPTRRDWEASAALYMEHYPGCLTLEWADPDYRDLWIFPRDSQTVDDAVHSVAGDERRSVLDLARQHRQPVIGRKITLPAGKGAVLAAAPVFSDHRLTGFVLNTMDISAAFGAMLADVSELGYEYVILQDGKPVYSPRSGYETRTKGGEDAEVPLRSVDGWTVRVWPQPALAAEMKSRLAEMLVATMAALGFLLIATVRLAKVAHRQTEMAQAAKDDMEQEVVERRRMEQAARVSGARFAGILEISADAIISADPDQRIVLFNQGAERLFGYRAEEVLGKPLEVLLPEDARAPHRHHVAQFASGDTATMRMCDRRSVVGRRKDGTVFPVEATVSKLVLEGHAMFTAILRDITDRVAAEEALRRSYDELDLRVQQRTAELATANASLRELSGSLLASQEEERRRIARELHDSTASNLVLALINLDNLQKCEVPAGQPAKDLEDGIKLIKQAISELRTASYRLHPPMLEEFGLQFALTWYVSGFSERSGIHIDVNIDSDLGRLPNDVELTMFRIVQEALANVHRHAHSNAASVTVRRNFNSVRLEIADHGSGITSETSTPEHSKPTLGVGIAGMRERVRLVGGSFELRSSGQGTIVTAAFPVSEAQSTTV
jgi:PAS domain S-box-containing protein